VTSPAASSGPLALSAAMADDLTMVEAELRTAVICDDPFLTEVASHLILAGGKRIRPGFALAAALGGDTEDRAVTHEVIMGAVSVELVHLGSLYHDDVMDEAITRRTVESVNARWGNLKAILAGDFLLARASEIAAALGTEVAGLLANTIARLCEGQVRELQDAYNVERTEANYLASIQGKTAALLATSCRVGAIVAALPRPLVDTVTDFGRLYGMAFQVVDDILDVVSTDEELGKPSGNDLVEGIYNLPVLRAFGTPQGPELKAMLGGPLDPEARDYARGLVRRSGSVEQSLVVAQGFADQAVQALVPLEGTIAGRSFGAAADDLILRVAAAAAKA
jgi:heptaprenyl diphosphate synthase